MALKIQRLTRSTSRKLGQGGFGRRRPMPTLAITHGTSISAMAMLTTTIRATITMCGWCEPDPKKMITDLMNHRVIDVNT